MSNEDPSDWDEDLPDWATEMDREILNALSAMRVLTPAVIADNIGRSREAVSRRLNTLEAGGLVMKKGRGKYKITTKGIWMTWERVELTDEEMEEVKEARNEEIEKFEALGTTKEDYEAALIKEFDRLREEKPGYVHFDELINEAHRIVEERISAENSGNMS